MGFFCVLPKIQVIGHTGNRLKLLYDNLVSLQKTKTKGNNLMNNKAKLLTIKQAAQVVDGITEYRIRQMCISGELPCFKAGKKYLINENVLLQTVVDEMAKRVFDHE